MAANSDHLTNLNVRNGQLGFNITADISDNKNLWDIYKAANKYGLNPLNDVIITLPEIGILSNNAFPGHHILIYNTSLDHTININTTENFLLSIKPKNSTILIAQNQDPNWFVFYNSSPTEVNAALPIELDKCGSRCKLGVETRTNSTKKIYNKVVPTIVQVDKVDFSIGDIELTYNLGTYTNKSGKELLLKIEPCLFNLNNTEYIFDIRLNSGIIHQVNCNNICSFSLYKKLLPGQVLKFYITSKGQDVVFNPNNCRISISKI